MSCEIQPAPQPPTNPPTGHQMSQQWKKMPNSGQIGSFLGKKSFFYWRNQKYCHPHTENPPKHLVHIGFWSDIGQNVKKWQYLAQNDQKCRFWTKFGRFRPKILIFKGVSKSFGTNITENHQDNLSAKSNFLGAGSKNFGTLVSGFQ